MFQQNMPITLVLSAPFLALLSFVAVRCFYDLFLHPLRKFPGPKRAAVWSFYEFYYDVVKDGLYMWEIKKMHEKYGPIVRINSHSLHIHDPEYFSTVYAGNGRRTNKLPSAVSGYTFPHSTITTIDHDLHRKRRAVLNPYFSKRSVVSLEPIIHERLLALCARLQETIGPGSTVDLSAAFSAFTADVVTHHFYGSHPDYVGSKDVKFGLKDALTALLEMYHITRFLPFEPTTVKNLPLPFLRLINPDFGLVITAREDNKHKVMTLLDNPEESKSKANSVIISALTDPEIPVEEKKLDRLLDEGETIIFAGIDTTARTLSVAFFHLLNEKKLRDRWRDDLKALSKGADHEWTTAELEAVPYLRGVVQEALRLTYGLVVRIPRIAIDEALQYQGYTIPPGTPVSQSTYLINNDTSVFPNPSVFDPERWIRAAHQGVNLDKYMVSFSKGTRACLGINLAYSMLYLAVAKVAISLEMDLFQTTVEDIECYHTRAFAFPKHGSGNISARVMGTV